MNISVNYCTEHHLSETAMTGFPQKEGEKTLKKCPNFSPGTSAMILKHELPLSCHAEDPIMFCIFELLTLVVLLISTFYSFVYITDCIDRKVIPARFLAS